MTSKLPGNIALCSTSSASNESPNTNCLGWDSENNNKNNNINVAVVVKPLAASNSNSNSNQQHQEQPPLNWRYENGLLRSLGDDGFATDLCLGPSNDIASLDTNALEPYELVLRDCPGKHKSITANGAELVQLAGKTENIFTRHDESAATIVTQRSATTNESLKGFEEKKQPPPPPPEQLYQQLYQQQNDQDPSKGRHMRFLIGGDGRIRSLAPVFDSTTPTTSATNKNKNKNRDLVAEQPFCVTAAFTTNESKSKSKSESETVTTSTTKAYLIPCFDHEEETHVYSNANFDSNDIVEGVLESEQSSRQIIFTGDQQLFELDARTDFESFLLDWQNENGGSSIGQGESESETETEIQLAYQIGHHGQLSSQKGTTVDEFDSYAIRLNGDHNSKDKDNTLANGLFETTLDQQSGIRTYPTSTYGPWSKSNSNNSSNNEPSEIRAYLLGKSAIENFPSSVLASTFFLVYNTNRNDGIEDAATSTPPAPFEQPPVSDANWPWAHLLFWGFMVCFAVLIKLHTSCRPNHKDHDWKKIQRESITTLNTKAAATLASAACSSEDSHRSNFYHHHHHQQRQPRRKSRRQSQKQKQKQQQQQQQRLSSRGSSFVIHPENLQQYRAFNSTHSRDLFSTTHSMEYLSNHSRARNLVSSHSRRFLEQDESNTSVPRIDGTQRTVANSFTSSDYLDEATTVADLGDVAMLGSDIEDGDDDVSNPYEDYTDDDDGDDLEAHYTF